MLEAVVFAKLKLSVFKACVCSGSVLGEQKWSGGLCRPKVSAKSLFELYEAARKGRVCQLSPFLIYSITKLKVFSDMDNNKGSLKVYFDNIEIKRYQREAMTSTGPGFILRIIYFLYY